MMVLEKENTVDGGGLLTLMLGFRKGVHSNVADESAPSPVASFDKIAACLALFRHDQLLSVAARAPGLLARRVVFGGWKKGGSQYVSFRSAAVMTGT